MSNSENDQDPFFHNTDLRILIMDTKMERIRNTDFLYRNLIIMS